MVAILVASDRIRDVPHFCRGIDQASALAAYRTRLPDGLAKFCNFLPQCPGDLPSHWMVWDPVAVAGTSLYTRPCHLRDQCGLARTALRLHLRPIPRYPTG